jgi:hypothetical protein
VPYKDPEQRRRYNTAYKRRSRATQAKNSPFESIKIYLCPRFPSLRVGLASFDNGFLITNRRDVQAQVERNPEFGVRIFPLALDLTRVTIEDE